MDRAVPPGGGPAAAQGRRRGSVPLFLVGVVLLCCLCCRPPAAGGDDTPIPPTPPPPPPPDEPVTTQRIAPTDLHYAGAFRLPDGPSDLESFQWGGLAMTHYPGGDPLGPADGFPGSLYVCGHAWQYRIAEISIPAPRLSTTRRAEELPTAAFLQPFHDILDVGGLELPRAGIAYLAKQGAQRSDKLHFCWGYHMQLEPPALTHGWCELELDRPEIRRGWYLRDLPDHIRNMSTNEYIFSVPTAWAEAYTGGMCLVTGRFRDGGWSGRGPSLFAVAPWKHGDPPPAGSGIAHIPLLLYTSTMNEEGVVRQMNDYHHSDEWSGGAWLTSGDKAAVVFAGTKGQGDCWYGNPQGPCLECENRGWWSTSFVGRILFYDPADFAAVARGTKRADEPQPYAVLDIDRHLYRISSPQQKHHLGAVAFDRANGILYICEYQGDGEKPLVHAWTIGH